MKRIINLAPAAIIALALLASCNKNDCDKSDPGLGGGGSVSGNVQHHGTAIPDAQVFIKYGATEFPGADTSQYDLVRIASSSDASYIVTDLKPGDYYLYAVGYDNSISMPVTGGVGIEICGEDDAKFSNIPVTE